MKGVPEQRVSKEDRADGIFREVMPEQSGHLSDGELREVYDAAQSLAKEEKRGADTRAHRSGDPHPERPRP